MKQAFDQVIDFLVPFGPAIRRADTQEPFKNWPLVLLRALPMTFFIFWLFSFIPLVGGFIYMLVLVPLSVRRHMAREKAPRPNAMFKLLTIYYVVILFGFGGIWSFIGHTFLATSVAQSIGWATSPFQTELAFFTLGTGVAGLLAIWIRDHLITALIVTKSIFWLGAAYVHINDAIMHQNFAPSNIGAPLIGDVIYPVLMLYLLYRYWRE